MYVKGLILGFSWRMKMTNDFIINAIYFKGMARQETSLKNYLVSIVNAANRIRYTLRCDTVNVAMGASVGAGFAEQLKSMYNVQTLRKNRVCCASLYLMLDIISSHANAWMYHATNRLDVQVVIGKRML